MNPRKRYPANSKKTYSDRKKTRYCNLCSQSFQMRSLFDRYCPNCKHESELLKFSEWLPEVDPEIQEQIPA